MRKISILTLMVLANSFLFAENTQTIQNDIKKIEPSAQVVLENQNLSKNENLNIQSVSAQSVPSSSQDFSDSLASKIDSKLEVINKQILEAQQIKASSLNIPSSQIIDEKRIEQYLPVMSGGYEIKLKNKKVEEKALTVDGKGQKYYLTATNNDMVKGIKADYLVYSNSETNKLFKSPMALPTKAEDVKISSTETINSLTPVAQDISKVPLPPLSVAVKEEVAKLAQ